MNLHRNEQQEKRSIIKIKTELKEHQRRNQMQNKTRKKKQTNKLRKSTHFVHSIVSIK